MFLDDGDFVGGQDAKAFGQASWVTITSSILPSSFLRDYAGQADAQDTVVSTIQNFIFFSRAYASSRDISSLLLLKL
jgi:hypothetical protein